MAECKADWKLCIKQVINTEISLNLSKLRLLLVELLLLRSRNKCKMFAIQGNCPTSNRTDNKQ